MSPTTSLAQTRSSPKTPSYRGSRDRAQQHIDRRWTWKLIGGSDSKEDACETSAASQNMASSSRIIQLRQQDNEYDMSPNCAVAPWGSYRIFFKMLLDHVPAKHARMRLPGRFCGCRWGAAPSDYIICNFSISFSIYLARASPSGDGRYLAINYKF